MAQIQMPPGSLRTSPQTSVGFHLRSCAWCSTWGREQSCSSPNCRFFLWTRVVQTTLILSSVSAPPSLGTTVSIPCRSGGRDLSDQPTPPDGSGCRHAGSVGLYAETQPWPSVPPNKPCGRWQVLDPNTTEKSLKDREKNLPRKQDGADWVCFT